MKEYKIIFIDGILSCALKHADSSSEMDTVDVILILFDPPFRWQ